MSGRMTQQKRKLARRRAQDAQAKRCAERRAAAERERRALAALAHHDHTSRRARRDARRDGLDSNLSQRLRHFSKVTGLPGKTQRRLRRMLRAVSTELNTLTCYNGLALLALVAQQAWVRKPEQFSAPRGHHAAQHRAFVSHMLQRWPVPAFLTNAIQVIDDQVIRIPVEQAWVLRLVSRLGQGGSLAERSLLPVPLTRKMQAVFRGSPANMAPIAALRRAQVVGAGGSEALARALCQTHLTRLQGTDPQRGEPWWHGTIVWLATRDGLPLERVPFLVRWLWMLRSLGEDYDPRGRPLASVLRRLDRFESQRDLLCGDRDWEPSGLRGAVVRDGPRGWEVREILSRADLLLEGQAMSHCAWQYHNRVQSRQVALFSLRRDGKRFGTLEVSLATSQLCQAKARANRPLPSEARAVVRDWADFNSLRVTRW